MTSNLCRALGAGGGGGAGASGGSGEGLTLHVKDYGGIPDMGAAEHQPEWKYEYAFAPAWDANFTVRPHSLRITSRPWV